MTTIDTSLLARAQAAAAVIAPMAGSIERERRLPAEAVSALAQAGVFKLLVPRIYGGAEASVGTLVAVIQTIAQADGAAGWCTMIGATSGIMSVFLEDDVAREVYGPADAVTCGVFAPMGRAAPVEGGYRVSGRWPFASGCEHSAWRMGGALVTGDAPPLLPSGAPDVKCMLFRSDETRVIDTWRTVGLRGTGSHDIEVNDVFVPASRSFSLITDPPRHPGSRYRLPFFGVLAAGVAAVALGIARGAIDAFVDLARSKRPTGSKRGLAQRELVQLHVAQAEARARAGGALLHEAIDAIEAEASAQGAAAPRSRALLRLAAAHATTEAAAAVNLVYDASGATAIYEQSPIQRHFRDVHTATQHAMVGPAATTLAGRILLGLETDLSMV